MSKKEDLSKKLQESDIQQVGQYMKMFDRMLLYTLATNLLPKSALHGTMKLWEKVIKKNIDGDCKNRTEFLETTIEGRKAKYEQEPDGEDMRLHSLKQFEIAREVVHANLFKQD